MNLRVGPYSDMSQELLELREEVDKYRAFIRLVHTDEPKQALRRLERVFVEGNAKHGQFDWKNHHPAEYLEKAQRHFHHRLMKNPIDESGEPHLIHAAADFLIATELEIHWLTSKGMRSL